MLRREFRRLRSSPGFIIGFVLPLALLSGVVGAASYFCYVLILKPLPYPHGERIVTVQHLTATKPLQPSSGRELTAWSTHSRLLDSAATAAPRSLMRWTTQQGLVIPLQGVAATSRFFDVFGVAPAIGRIPTLMAGDPGIVISWSMWRTRLGGRPDVLGTAVNLEGSTMVIRAVMPRDFDAPRLFYPAWKPPDVWMAHPGLPDTDARDITVVARLAPGAQIPATEAEMQAIALSAAATSQRPHPQLRLTRGQDAAPESTQETARATAAGAAVLLLLGLVNAAPLYLTRIQERLREVSTLTALGASRSRIAVMFASEILLLAAAVGAIAALLSGPLLTILASLAPQKLARLSEVQAGAELLAGAGLLGGIATVISCAVAAAAAFPAIRAGLLQLPTLRQSRPSGRLRSVLLSAQVALSVALVAGAVLLARTVVHLQTVERGFEPKGLNKVGYWLPPGRSGSDALRLPLAVASNPGRDLSAIATSVPGTRAVRTIAVKRHEEEDVAFGNDSVSSSYFETLGIPLVAGRPHRDDSDAEVVIDTRVAEWLGRTPQELSGQTVALLGKARVIAGVAMAIPSLTLERAKPMVYSSYAKETIPAGFLFVRSAEDAVSLSNIQQRATSEIPGVMLFGYESLWDRLARDYERQWFLLTISLMAAGAAILMAVLGMAGFVLSLFRGRRQELAIRAALGATPSQLRWLTVRGVGLCVLCGSLLGIPLASVSGALLRSVLLGPAAVGLYDAIALSLFLTAAAFLICVQAVRSSELANLTTELRRDA